MKDKDPMGTIALLATMLNGVKHFNQQVIGVEIPDRPQMLSPERAVFRKNHINEETDELLAAEEVMEQADAFVDAIYIALGGLVEMGIVPAVPFAEVQRANMDKVQGELSKRPGSQGFDAIKPPGWEGPDLSAIFSITPAFINAMSPVLREIVELRLKKGQDYNSSVQLTDYFPMGHASYFQMIHMKTKRAESLIDVLQKGGTPNFEGLRDTLLDLINYASFWVEFVDSDPEVLAAWADKDNS